MKISLPSIDGDFPLNSQCIYFSCDSAYYEKYGKPLLTSIVSQIPWIGVHCHLISFDKNFSLFKDKNVSHTVEIVDEEFINSLPVNQSRIFSSEKYNFSPSSLTTYYACARFIRAQEIFDDRHSILQIDCDSILCKPFSEEEFLKVTERPLPTRKPKKLEKVLASCISLGSGDNGVNFRQELSQNMINSISEGIYWFIDQDVLEQMFNTGSLDSIPNKWNNWNFKDPDAYFRTAKGNKKDSELFLNLLKRWSIN